jgi:hypothetical protein
MIIGEHRKRRRGVNFSTIACIVILRLLLLLLTLLSVLLIVLLSVLLSVLLLLSIVALMVIQLMLPVAGEVLLQLPGAVVGEVSLLTLSQMRLLLLILVTHALVCCSILYISMRLLLHIHPWVHLNRRLLLLL